MGRSIATIGYEGATPQSFIDTLRRHGIDLIIDVRAVPFSRKKGFSKNALAAMLEENGINYVHLEKLGNPLKTQGVKPSDAEGSFHAVFGRHLETADAQQELRKAADLSASYHACLLCFEKEHDQCHRSLVAEALAPLTHLPIQPLRLEEKTRGKLMEDLFD